MARKKSEAGRGLGHKETQVLHLKEFSQESLTSFP